jgi:hypothetical protein
MSSKDILKNVFVLALIASIAGLLLSVGFQPERNECQGGFLVRILAVGSSQEETMEVFGMAAPFGMPVNESISGSLELAIDACGEVQAQAGKAHITREDPEVDPLWSS